VPENHREKLQKDYLMTYYKLGASYCEKESELKAFEAEFEKILESSLEDFKESVAILGEVNTANFKKKKEVTKKKEEATKRYFESNPTQVKESKELMWINN